MSDKKYLLNNFSDDSHFIFDKYKILYTINLFNISEVDS